MHTVSGVYQDEASLTRAVQMLQQRSVPANTIHLWVDDGKGHRKEVPVDLESGVMRGAKIGATIGAVTGGVLFLLGSLGTVTFPGAALVASSVVLAAIQGAIAGTAAGGAFGGLIGIGRFFSKPHIESELLKGGSAVLSVHSDELLDVAEKVLTETGADRIHTGADHA